MSVSELFMEYKNNRRDDEKIITRRKRRKKFSLIFIDFCFSSLRQTFWCSTNERKRESLYFWPVRLSFFLFVESESVLFVCKFEKRGRLVQNFFVRNLFFGTSFFGVNCQLFENNLFLEIFCYGN